MGNYINPSLYVNLMVFHQPITTSICWYFTFFLLIAQTPVCEQVHIVEPKPLILVVISLPELYPLLLIAMDLLVPHPTIMSHIVSGGTDFLDDILTFSAPETFC